MLVERAAIADTQSIHISDKSSQTLTNAHKQAKRPQTRLNVPALKAPSAVLTADAVRLFCK